MTYCTVANQIAEHANQPESESISEILRKLINDEVVHIDGEEVEMYQITDSIDEEELRQAAHENVLGNGLAIYQLYIKALEDFING